MQMTEQYTALKRQLAAFLANAGWKTPCEFDVAYTIAVASKDYDTEVGVKTAQISLIPTSEGDFKAVGNYQSEGGDVLSTTWLTIGKSWTPEQVEKGAVDFAARVDREVDMSYARKLFLGRKTETAS